MIASLALLSATVVIVSFWRRPESVRAIMEHLIEANTIARIVGILLIVPAIVALGLTDRVDNNAAIAALSAIAGYVLGSAGAIRPRD